MTSRKMPRESAESARKRRRVMDDERDIDGAAASFDSLNADCKVNVFSFLLVPDLNTVALCNKDCCAARNNESLDQARTGTIVLTPNCTASSVRNAVVAAEQKNIFSGNCTSLKIVGVERGQWSWSDSRLPFLTGVTKLHISPTPFRNEEFATANYDFLRSLLLMCPNATDVVFDSIKVPRHRTRSLDLPPNFKRLEWKGGNGLLLTGGLIDDVSEADLRELYLDKFEYKMCCSSEGSMELYGSTGPGTFCLFEEFLNLERVSIKGATVHFNFGKVGSNEEPLPQEYIFKFVRRCSTLRWLRNDLSAENVAMLKAERPGVTFVSD